MPDERAFNESHSPPIDKPIIVSFRWTSEEFLRMQELQWRYSNEDRMFRKYLLRGGIFFVISGIVLIALGGKFVLPGAMLAGVGFITLLSPFFPQKHALDHYAQKPDHNRVVTCEISANRIVSRSDAGSSEALWRGFIRAYRAPEGFLLFQTDRQTYWLPVSGFQNPADIERLAEMLKSNAKEYSDVR